MDIMYKTYVGILNLQDWIEMSVPGINFIRTSEIKLKKKTLAFNVLEYDACSLLHMPNSWSYSNLFVKFPHKLSVYYK